MKRSWTVVFFVLGVMAYWSLAAGAEEKGPPEIRVGLLTGAKSVQVCVPDGGALLDAAGSYIARADQGALVFTLGFEGGLVRGPVDSSAFFTVLPGGGFVLLNGRPYRGRLTVRAADNGLVAVERIGLEAYLRGVVPREVPAAWPMEALKAQAVAARTYTLANLKRHDSQGYDLCAGVHCQAYGGAAAEHPRTDQAVAETAGVVAMYGGKLISALYHSSSGGHTENSGSVWAWDAPYLKGISDEDVSPNAYWYHSVTPPELEDALRAAGRDIGTVSDLVITETGVSGRVARIRVIGTDGSAELTGEQFRTLLGLRSTYFTILWRPDPSAGPVQPHIGFEPLTRWSPGAQARVPLGVWAPGYEPPRWVLAGRGWGHGVGMSQWGAMSMASRGHTYEDILRYYYQGITLQNLFEEVPAPGLQEEGSP